ncbi:hypothetical protein [Pseudoalteromonas sp. BDTF-M6]|uniref:hypothetical protein n=1 Tax=Pseudoalteromonas sp. BDTF-M6 TaxID=2796132 RepID=UPI001BAEC39F|nr:hypothetical protein [Pseudoalteromonas sp. BDTF-M6]MBS3797237.1 hypothetical protein [Pseudoalteromonas sp. BDTF-M6]
MKKLLLLVVILLALLSVDHPLIKNPRDKILGKVVSDLSDSTQVQREVRAKHALTEIRSQLNLDKEQDAHLAENFRTVRSMHRWEQLYCKDRNLNQYFYGDDLLQSCTIIAATH